MWLKILLIAVIALTFWGVSHLLNDASDDFDSFE
jgi:hypothetical protein